MIIEISYKGANCLAVQTKQLLVVDPVIDGVASNIKALDKARVQLTTNDRFIVEPSIETEQLLIHTPGEYEIGDMSITGVAAQAHLDADGQNATMYRLNLADELTVAVLGHVLGDTITDEQLETLGLIDILFIPVGGGGYTLDSHIAAKLVRRIEPKIVVPVHYAEDGVAYEVPQDSLDAFCKELGIEPLQEQTLKIKNGQLPDALTVIQLAKVA